MSDTPLEAAYQHCLAMARGHYENFPVASVALPKHLRLPVAVIYAFARTADDFADEGEREAQTRLTLLDEHRQKLHQIEHGDVPDDPIFLALQAIVKKHNLPIQLFHDLITAFTMDVTKTRYADYNEVLHYCRYSANPVGRLLLHLYEEASDENLRDSDAICSALQLINFWQDIQQDYVENDRIYLPQDDMKSHGVDETQLQSGVTTQNLRALMDQQILRSRELMLAGAPLGRRLPGRLGIELRLTVHGGLRILDALYANRDNVFARPRLSKRDWLSMLWRALVNLTP